MPSDRTPFELKLDEIKKELSQCTDVLSICIDRMETALKVATAERDAARRDLAEALEALRPFVTAADCADEVGRPDRHSVYGELSFGDMRRARDVLARIEGRKGEGNA